MFAKFSHTFQRYNDRIYLVLLHANPLSETSTAYTCIYSSEIQKQRKGRYRSQSRVTLFTVYS